MGPASSEAKRTYNPTSVELIKCIEDVLNESPDANPKEVHASLLKKPELEKWKVPERRVAKFVKRAKSANDDDDDQSIQSTGTMSSIRKYFKERKARKEAKREAKKAKRQEGGSDADDDASIRSSSSMSSVRKFFARDRSNQKNCAAAPMKVVVPQNSGTSSKNWGNSVSPLKPKGSPRADAFDNQQSELNAKNYDADDDDASVSSFRKFLKNRKAKKAEKKKQKEASKAAAAVAPMAILSKDASSVSLLSPLPQSEEEPDLFDLKDVPTYDSYMDNNVQVEDKVAHGKADLNLLVASPAGASDKTSSIGEPQSPATANTTIASRELEGLYTEEQAPTKSLCSGCALWNPFTKASQANLVA
mmetsp:Transcript_6198/g.13791  ORF Transcript_6198/g.13791 Transcript_6198/m.13791 type:complete len:361 (-) Transcript_6198:88-1170(-)